MWKLALCLCVAARLVSGQLANYKDVSTFACDKNLELMSRTEETGSVKSPCYGTNTYPEELTSGIKLINITFDSPHLFGFVLTVVDFKLDKSDRLYIGRGTTSYLSFSRAWRNVTLNPTTTNDILVEYSDGTPSETLTLNDTNTLLLEGYTSVFMDFYTIASTEAGRGFHINYTADVNKCLFTGDDVYCKNEGNCTRTGVGTASCSCVTGWTGTTCAQDIDECADPTTNTCDDASRATCTNNDGSFVCTCKSGYTGDGKDCTNVNECNTDNDVCHDDFATCTDNDGSFTCACNTGFTGDGVSCDNINECDGPNDCHSNATCRDNTGSYTCACKDGFSGNGRDCADDDECTINPNSCHARATCTNTVGSFTCACDAGFVGSGTECSDDDECGRSETCDGNASCENNEGSFTCTCNNGYTGSGLPGNCGDVNECNGDHGCDDNADCINEVGGFTCRCRSGYTGSGTSCEDINECDNNGTCDDPKGCKNNNGSFTCTCSSGYTGSGLPGDCEDIDECSDPALNDCTAAETTCENKPGGHDCVCNGPIFRGTPGNCDYYCEHNSTCLAGRNGFIEVPLLHNGTLEYSAFDETFWNFEGTRGIRFFFVDFNTEKKDDFLSIYYGDTVNTEQEVVGISGRIGDLYNEEERVTTSGDIHRAGLTPAVEAYLNLDVNPITLTLDQADLLVEFTSDRLNVSTGFVLRFEYDQDDCPSTNPCEHGGNCDDRPFAYQCINCPGWTGVNCEIDIDECTTSPCDSNAACANTQGTYTCTCNEFYTGDGFRCNQHIVIDNLNVIKTTSSLSVNFDITSVYRTADFISSFVIGVQQVTGPSSQRFEVDLAELPFLIPNLETYTQYNVTIEINSTGRLFGSSVVENNILSTLVFTAQSTPATPINLQTTIASRDRVTLTWEKPVEEGFGKITHYEICYAPSAAESAIAALRGLSTADQCLILDDTYVSITLTDLFRYIEMSFKIRAYSSQGSGSFTNLVVAFTGDTCGGVTSDSAGANCDNTKFEELLVSDGFPRTVTSTDNNVLERYWRFDLSSIEQWRINVIYFDLVERESTLDYGFGSQNINDHDAEKAALVESFTGSLSSGAMATITKNAGVSNENFLWFAFISDRTRKRPGFQVEIERGRDNCDSNPCLHAGVCTNGEFSYTCDCTNTDWTGTSCENPHVKPSFTCTRGRRQLVIAFSVQNRWAADETVIGGFTLQPTGGSAVQKQFGESSETFTGLTPFTEYTITLTVMSSSRKNVAYNTFSESCTTLEDQPTEPRNVAVSASGTDLVVTWQAPSEPNGIVSYTVSFVSMDHGTYSETVISGTSGVITGTTYTIPGAQLKAYRTFEVTVNASTSAGWTEADPVSERTNPGAPPTFTATVTVITNRSARVEVDLATPSSFPGPITLTISAESAIHSAMQDSVVIGHGVTTSSTVYDKLEEGQIYNITITASTGTAPDQTRIFHNVNTDSIAPGLTEQFSYDPATSTFTWTTPAPLDRNGEITGYVLKAISTVPGFTEKVFNASETSFQLTGLAVYTQYTFSMQAINSAGRGMENVKTFTTREEVPATPSVINMVSATDSSITISWPVEDPPVGNTTYEITYTTGTQTETVITDQSSETIEGLAPFTEYSVTIVAVTGAGEAAPTAVFTFQTEQGTPSAVQNPAVAMNTQTYEIEVTWEAPTTANGIIASYSITWSYESTTDSFVVNNPTATSYNISSVTQSSTQYNISIFATTGGGNGPSVETSLTTPILLPDVPRNPTVTDITATSAVVNAISPINANSIAVEKYIITLNQNLTDCQKQGDESCLTDSVEANTLPHTLTLKAYRRYILSLAAEGAAGIGPSTANINFRTLVGVPGAPFAPITSLVPGGVSVTFNASSPFTGPASYNITVTPASGNPIVATIEETGIFSNLTVTVYGLSGSTEYTVTIVAFNSQGTSGSSASSSITTTPAAPTISINRTSSTSLSVTITPDSEAVSYTITYIESACTGTCNTTSRTTTDTSISITELAPYTTYNISVYATGSGGAGLTTQMRERTSAGDVSLISDTYAPSQSNQTLADARPAYTVILENLCLKKEQVWDPTNGPVLDVAYVVRQKGATGSVSLTTYYGQVHADEPSPPFVALTITCSTSNRRKRRVETEGVVIGDDNTCPAGGTTECNGPLKPGTTYTFQACGINEVNSFACTSESEEITTDDAPTAQGLTAGEIAAIVICSILLLILIILLIVFLVKRRRSRGKHTVSGRGRDNPSFDTKASQQKYQIPTGDPQTQYTEPSA